MLVIKRYNGQKVIVAHADEEFRIKVECSGYVKLHFEADRSFRVHRAEVEDARREGS